ncbi:CTP synthase [Candidatus Saccharibacteria bacterium]|nr:CTP synthase [Candidatus Saccharibacteria bacterium]MCL1963288.1 CTP synthase [Candidatus Saccharibacteria bacterium]
MANKNIKYIFVTGGVISGVGKGITAASIGAILKAKGLKVSMQKCDPYFNVDAGLLNPAEHGECFVTRDGAETDLDLGHYERFLDEEMTDDSIQTSGKLLYKLLNSERAGKFGGKSVQLIPHFTGAIQDTFEQAANEHGSDIHIVEIGGTIGDLEGSHFVEAIREFPTRVGRENCFYVHVVFVPYLTTSHEFKTKPAQNALRDLRGFGIVPNMVAARVDVAKAENEKHIKMKLATFCGVGEDSVIILPNAKSVYQIPLNVVRAGALKPLDTFVNHGEPDMTNWKKLVERIDRQPSKTVTVGLVAKYVDNTDTYLSVTEALKAAAWAEGIKLDLKWINAEKLADANRVEPRNPRDRNGADRDGEKDALNGLQRCDGIVVPGGFGTRGLDGKIAAADYALANNKPYLGLCLGLQMAVIAAARRGGLTRATTEEIDSESPENVVYIMEGQKGKESTGGTMRLGDYPAKLVKNSRTAKIYDAEDVIERHRHRYEVNQKFLPEIEKGGVVVSGTSPDGKLVEFIEAPSHRFFFATQAHPEFKSRPMRPHPLFQEFIKSLKEGKK